MNFKRGLATALIIISILFLSILNLKTYSYNEDILRLNSDFTSLEKKLDVKNGNWSEYLESKMNRVSKSNDEYQYSTSERIRILEEQVRKLERLTKPQNNNNNVNINNIKIDR